AATRRSAPAFPEAWFRTRRSADRSLAGRFRSRASLHPFHRERAMIDHLKRLGVTTIELLPIHGLIDDRVLVEKKLSNYWGYNTI
ncbi:hypothetical protein, partial [Bradyrhizobium uaiense]|nr:hypothetical protein [Bradyrhizobium uaiense]